MTKEQQHPEAETEMAKPIKERDGRKLSPIGARICETEPKATSGNVPKKELQK